MAKEVVVNGCKFKITPATIGGAQLTVSSVPSQKVLAENKGCYFGTLVVILQPGATYNGGTLANPVTFNIQGTGANMLENNQKVLLKGDKATVNAVSFPVPNSSPQVTNVTVEVSDAGQTKVTLS